MFRVSWLPFAVWSLFILILCGIPGRQVPRLDFLSWLKPDKIVHLFLFGVQCYLLLRVFSRQPADLFLKLNQKLLAALICVLYGVLIEVLQEYVFIDRTGDVRDALADAIGAVMGMWVFGYRLRRRAEGADKR